MISSPVLVDAIIRVSLQQNDAAHVAVSEALVGDPREPTGPGPFERVDGSAFICNAKPDAEVTRAIADFARALDAHATSVDYVSITYVRK